MTDRDNEALVRKVLSDPSLFPPEFKAWVPKHVEATPTIKFQSYQVPDVAPTGYGTSLPGSPKSGQEYILVDSATSPTFQWRFRYNAGSALTDKWEFIGGSVMASDDGSDVSTVSASYQDLGGPGLTVPRAGVYYIQLFVGQSYNVFSTGAGLQRMASAKLGAAAASDAESGSCSDNSTTSAPSSIAWSGVRTLAAGDVVKIWYKLSFANGTGHWARRSLSIVPIRVS